MKASDLMIGDWIMFKYTQHQFKVYSINHDEISTKDAVPFEISDAVIPIPLTPAILEKNGFEVSSEHARFYFEENGYDDGEIKHSFVLRKMYRIDNTKEQKGWAFYSFNVLTIIDYVHELQHALKLCGIEKEIIV